MAQGQAIMSTAVNTFIVLLGSIINHMIAETKAMVSTAMVNLLPILSVKV